MTDFNTYDGASADRFNDRDSTVVTVDSGSGGVDGVDEFDSAEALPDLTAAVRAIVQQVQRARIAPPPVQVRVVTHPSTKPMTTGADDALARALGGGSRDGVVAPFASLPALPALRRAYEQFSAAIPTSRVFRLDTPESYRQFRAARRGAATIPEIRIPLSIEPSAHGGVICWQDGDEILCSLRVRARDGRGWIVTTGTPYTRHAEDALLYAAAAGVDPVELADTFDTVIRVIGGASLLPQFAVALPDLLAIAARTPEPFTAEVVSLGDAALAAVMFLVQCSERGYSTVTRELAELRDLPGGADLITQATDRLRAARAEGAGRTK